MSCAPAIVAAAALALVRADAPRVVVLGPAPPVVAVGETATWTVRLEGAESTPSLALPDVEELSLSASPPRADVVRALVDGEVVVRHRTAFDVTAAPGAEGRFTLPRFLVGDGDGAWSSDPPRPLLVVGGPGPAGGGVAFCEVVPARDEVYLGEPFRATVRFGFATDFLEESLVPLFPRRLDVPVQLAVPWLEGHADARVAASGGAGARATLALDDREGTARRTDRALRDGRTFTVFELERRVVPTASGSLALGAPTLRYAYATRFREGLFERTPEDRHEAVAAGAPAVVRVRPLPDEGRPAAFAGAVGRFTVSATAEPRAVRVGETVRVTVVLDPDGDAEPGAPPPLALGDGFHVRGRLDEVDDGGRRTVTIDATPTRGGVAAVGPFPFVFFDPEEAAYRVVEAPEIPLAVEGAPGALSADEGGDATARPAARPSVRPIPGVNDLYDVRPVGPARAWLAEVEGTLLSSLRGTWWAGALALPWLLGLVFGLLWRARERRRRDPDGHRARRAAFVFRGEARRGFVDEVAAFERYLAARLQTSEAAVVGPELEARLVAAGVDADLAAETARELERRRAARFGGPQATESEEELEARVERLERAFDAAEGDG